MLWENHIGRNLLVCFSATCLGILFSAFAPKKSLLYINENIQFNDSVNKNAAIRSSDLEKLNKSLHKSIAEGDTVKSRLILNQISISILTKGNDSLILSDSYYYTGVFYFIAGKYSESEKNFEKSSSVRDKLRIFDTIYAKSFYNLGVICNSLGDYNRMEEYTLKSVEAEKKLFGESSPQLALGYSSLATASLGLKEYDRAINYGNTALKLIDDHKEIYNSVLADLYTNMGVCYIKLSDHSKAVLFLEKAEEVYMKYKLPKDERYINLLNSLAAAYFYLDENDKSDKYYTMGIDLADTYNTFLSQNFVNSFAKVMGSAGKINKGEELILISLQKAEKLYGKNSGIYIYVLKNYADYLREFKIDHRKSLMFYEECIGYLDNHEEDLSLKGQIFLGYALSLSENGHSEKALNLVQDLIYSGISNGTEIPETDNPDINKIKPDQWSLSLFKAKYKIIWDLYRKSGELKYLIVASATSGLLVAIIEKVRINIDEEDSRLVLGDRYRDFYLSGIRDCDLCFKVTGKREFIEKAFELSEKSKVAALLTATRELKATQFHIPAPIAEHEKQLQDNISFYNAKISVETAQDNPDPLLLSGWKSKVFDATLKRDSLINLFEKEYPGYFLIKYNTRVINPAEIPASAGRNINYISYVAGDTVMYIFVANRKVIHMTTHSIDPDFYDNIREFRKLITSPPLNDVKSDYFNYQRLGSYIYETVFKPIEKHLISNKLLISPDNILSYIPFEAIPRFRVQSDNVFYNDLPYLIKQYNISYAYSATFLAESIKSGLSLSKKLIAFAPLYTGAITMDSLLLARQHRFIGLNELPYARMEAEFACRYVGGMLYAGNEARESVFKSEAGEYDIIHMAMHTIINDQDPMHSKMIFSQSNDPVEDGVLNTYEVYGIPLKAKMIILSSCNTGTGLLHSGEGILSLARGFMYSGSQSVIMSLWEIDDRSGTDIVEDFYRSLKRGATKSISLRKARINYIKEADMLKSHPYFWSTLVVYGNNERLYFSGQLIFITGIIIFLLCAILAFFYLRSR